MYPLWTQTSKYCTSSTHLGLAMPYISGHYFDESEVPSMGELLEQQEKDEHEEHLVNEGTCPYFVVGDECPFACDEEQ